ncbi:hypothetical protein BGZ97_000101 [Linnemannia gamsii]|uniref:FAD-binding domain-containing protein n=1 Tax=Linnemannia gamsii TaxID=64522 RepID=A0A9P6R3U7_9FUNG|nr:hypothetical protein BGZ97_000101 [Linnemannia gamsii]
MSNTNEKPTVLIVGAGLGGLMLGALLEKSGVPYNIFERAASVKPLGSAMSVGPTLLPIFQQLGIYDEILSIGKYITHTETHQESLVPYRPTDYRPIEDYTGYGQYIVARPKYYDIMLKLIPPHKIHFGKRVLNISEDENKANIHLSNNEMFQGDIVVGADGAYSAVRQRMYEQLKAKGKLPREDQEDLPFSCTCLVGQTKVLDPEEFPCIKDPICQFRVVFGEERPFSTMCDETRNFGVPLSDGKKRTLGDLYDLTPKDLISKVMLEEKVFKTWHNGRTVLLGDACHKLSPTGGHGAVTAMHDAIALANLIYAVPTTNSVDLTKIFEEYQKERIPAVMASYNHSQLMSKIMDRGIEGAVILWLYTHIPFWLWKLVTVRYRPQVGFLKPIPLKGSIVPFESSSEFKARAAFAQQTRCVASI